MKRPALATLGVLVALAWVVAAAAAERRAATRTTDGGIAIENLDHQIAQPGDAGSVDLLLARARFLADYRALNRASVLAEQRSATAADLVQRARARSAVHRFADALADLDAAERRGASAEAVEGLRASILVATGRAAEAVPLLEAGLARRPEFASRSALAVAYASLGRLDEADRLYARALEDLDTTLPFPYAWTCFARGMMWAEQGGDRERAAGHYARALEYLPDFAAAGIHLAELDVARGDTAAALARLERVVRSSGEPEALALLGRLHTRLGDAVRGADEITRARQTFETLLSRQPLAFADHAAEFYLGAGADPERAWELARMNLANRPTERALALAVWAAEASGRPADAYALLATRHP